MKGKPDRLLLQSKNFLFRKSPTNQTFFFFLIFNLSKFIYKEIHKAESKIFLLPLKNIPRYDRWNRQYDEILISNYFKYTIDSLSSATKWTNRLNQPTFIRQKPSEIAPTREIPLS